MTFRPSTLPRAVLSCVALQLREAGSLAGLRFFLRSGLRRQAFGPSYNPRIAFFSLSPKHIRGITACSSLQTTGGFADVQKVFAECANAEA